MFLLCFQYHELKVLKRQLAKTISLEVLIFSVIIYDLLSFLFSLFLFRFNVMFITTFSSLLGGKEAKIC